MASKELFYDQRPIALLDTSGSNRIDPRFTFTRNSIASYTDRSGVIRYAQNNQPRFSADTAGSTALLVEKQTTNFIPNSNSFSTSGSVLGFNISQQNSAEVAPDGSTNAKLITGLAISNNTVLRYTATITAGTYYTGSIYVKRTDPNHTSVASLIFSEAGVSGRVSFIKRSDTNLPLNTWVRQHVTYLCTTSGTIRFDLFGGTNLDLNQTLVLWGWQFEDSDVPTSLIQTSGSSVTRAADLLTIETLSIPSSGSVYIDSKAISTLSGPTLVSIANNSNAMVNLAYESRSETYNSTALVASYSGNVKPTLPLAVPTTSRTRSVVTWGAQNYQHSSGSSRSVPSFSASVPSGLTKLSIGHNAVDPSKTFIGFINTLYLYAGEIPPDIAEGLVRSDLVSINADTYTAVGPSGSLSLIINTQGAGSDGNNVFTLPASRATIAATALVVGETYRILSVGTTNFTLVGASANTVGTVFVATGAGTGTGTVAWQNDLVITWGDGTESGLEGAAAEGSAVGLTKTYSQAGIFPVWVSGRMQDIAFNNGTHAPDLVRITTWGTGKMLVKPSTMANAFYGCSKLQSIPSTNLPDTSAVTSWSSAFRNCSSLTGTFPSFNTTAATTFANAWENCSSLTGFPLLSTSNVTSFVNTWYGCSGLTTFPQIVTSSATTMTDTWRGCTGLTSFPLLTTNNVTSMMRAWYGCSGLTSFPELNTAAVTSFFNTWSGCSGLTSFPAINTVSATNMQAAWGGCSGLTTFPLLNTASVTDFGSAWSGCSALTSFPLINTANGTNLSNAWNGCSALTSFPLIDTSKATSVSTAWENCSSLTSFPTLTLSLCTNISLAWRNCSGLTAFPSINFPAITNAYGAWQGCTGLTSFPSITLGPVTGAPSDVSNTGFALTWASCTNLSSFPSGMFNTVTATRFTGAFSGCALTAASIENILVSINTANTSNGSLGLNGGTNAGATTWTANAVTAYNALIARGWTITRNA